MSGKHGNGNGGRRSLKLLIVDDSNLMRRRIERSQQFEELQVVGTAGNGLEALEMFHKTDPDVVTMDAGRGVGMDVVARTVYGLGGRIGVSTNPGRFTRFKIVLPAAEAASSAVA